VNAQGMSVVQNLESNRLTGFETLEIAGSDSRKVISRSSDSKMGNLGDLVQSNMQMPVNVARFYREIDHNKVQQTDGMQEFPLVQTMLNPEDDEQNSQAPVSLPQLCMEMVQNRVSQMEEA
jgi:hypothetical protein